MTIDSGHIHYSDITVLILCGGGSRRMGGEDKGLIDFNGKPMILHSIEELSRQFPEIFISANNNIDQYQSLGHQVIQDSIDDAGPLGGIYSALQKSDKSLLLITTCDTPLIDIEIAERLIRSNTKSEADIHVAHDGKHMQMLHALLNIKKTELKASLARYLEKDRSVKGWYQQLNVFEVDCSDLAQHFSNINTPEDLFKASN
ncbi:MAG: molybdenum cofactor guanylyltransferase [Gammaproteobacteria bacterium]|nr:molybdenum cofactor guanylyltransferase [Gammaproteobacteria bacterium]